MQNATHARRTTETHVSRMGCTDQETDCQVVCGRQVVQGCPSSSEGDGQVVSCRGQPRNLPRGQNVTAFLMDQNHQFEQAINGLRFAKDGLDSARLRNHDILTSLDVLSTGTYRRLPSAIKVCRRGFGSILLLNRDDRNWLYLQHH